MLRLLITCLLVMWIASAYVVYAQQAAAVSAGTPTKEPPPVATPAAMAPSEVAAAYRLGAARQRVAELQAKLMATAEYKAYDEALKAANSIEADLAAKVKAKTGKVFDWQTGALK
jgi:hypothetical protein